MNSTEKIFAYIIFLGWTLSTNESIQNFNIMTILFIIFVWPFVYCIWNMLFHRMSINDAFVAYFVELKNEYIIVANIFKKIGKGIYFVIEKIKNSKSINKTDK